MAAAVAGAEPFSAPASLGPGAEAEAEPALRQRRPKPDSWTSKLDYSPEAQESTAADGWAAETGEQADVEQWVGSLREVREGMAKMPSGLEYRCLRMAPASAPSLPGPATPCKCHFRGRLAADGREFDSSYGTGSIVLRPEQAVKGWAEALLMMRQGDKWELYIPSELAYGEKGFGLVPPKADLLVEVDLREVNAKETQGPQFEFSIVLRVFLVTVLGLILVIYHHYVDLDKATSREGSSAMARGPRLPVKVLAGLPTNPKVFFDMEVSGKHAGRIEFELFSSVVPRTAENFRALATGERGSTPSGARLHYKGSKFHRIIPGFMSQGGDFENANGEGGESIYGGVFQDEWEHAVIQHSMPGLLSMANRGKADTNGAQFIITVAATPWLDDRHVVFGRVTRGLDVLKHLEAFGSKSGRPTEAVIIANCGQM